MKRTLAILITSLILVSCQTNSDLKLPSLIGDNMLLQQKTNVKIWGKANPGSKISVSAGWNTSSKGIAGEDGNWQVSLPTPEAGGPYEINIAAADTSIIVKNVLIGEVWFCSGQSNMEMPLAGWPPNDTIMHSSSAIAAASIPEIRLFNLEKKISGEPLDDCTGKWEICTPESAKQFSATAFFFGRKLHKELNVPVGLIESAWGGTPSESWTSEASLLNAGEFVSEIKAIKESAPVQAEYQKWLDQHKHVELNQGDAQYKDLDFDDGNIASPEFSDNDWPAMNIPSLFEKTLGEFDGAVWFRRIIDIPENMAGKDLVLSLGPIDDMDRTYLNGKLVGSTEMTGFWGSDRNYEIPASLVKTGSNLLAVRVIDNQGGGGIYGLPGKIKISVKDDAKLALPLAGEWKYQPVADFRDTRFYVYDIARNEFQTTKRPLNLSAGTPTVLYNGMVSPVLPYQIKGAIWYQGEANVGRADQYSKIFPAMIQNWREAWNIKDFPFYFAQIAPYVYAGIDSCESAYLREAQESALQLPNTGMAITLDITTVNNIHPPYKMEVGERLALLALNKDYGMKIPYMGPVFKSMSVSGNTVRIQFENTGGGLVARNIKPGDFEVAGKNGKFVKANAKIMNMEVWVASPEVKEPAAVRYCWRNGSEASLFNMEGLAALQFRTK